MCQHDTPTVKTCFPRSTPTQEQPVIIPKYDLYAVLGVPMSADKAAIRRAYCRRIRQLHPDLHPEHERARLHEQAAKVTTAWEYLADPIKRREYDASRPATPPPRSTPPPPPPRPSPPPPPRTVIQNPAAVEFGIVSAGDTPERQMVRLSFGGGSPVRKIHLAREAGRFWRATVVLSEDGRSARIYFDGLAIPRSTPSGRLVDQLHIQIDEAAVDIPLSVTVKAVPRPPTPAAPQPRTPPSPSAPPPPPQPSETRPGRTARPSYSAPQRRHAGKRIASCLTVLLALSLAAAFVAHSIVDRLAGRHAGSTPHASGEYCSVSTYQGEMLTFYRTKPGTNQRANDTPVWYIMTPKYSGPYIAWMTSEFPYWEHANLRDGFTVGDKTYRKFQYVEVSAVWANGWEPLTTVFTHYPNLTGGPKGEAARRQQFLNEWRDQDGSPKCS